MPTGQKSRVLCQLGILRVSMRSNFEGRFVRGWLCAAVSILIVKILTVGNRLRLMGFLSNFTFWIWKLAVPSYGRRGSLHFGRRLPGDHPNGINCLSDWKFLFFFHYFYDSMASVGKVGVYKPPLVICGISILLPVYILRVFLKANHGDQEWLTGPVKMHLF